MFCLFFVQKKESHGRLDGETSYIYLSFFANFQPAKLHTHKKHKNVIFFKLFFILNTMTSSEANPRMSS